MQEDLNLDNILQDILFDVYNEDRFIVSLSAHHECSFDNLHYIICEHLHLHPQARYRFYIPKCRYRFALFQEAAMRPVNPMFYPIFPSEILFTIKTTINSCA